MKIILKIISVLIFILGLIFWKSRKELAKKALALIGISVVIYIVAAYISEQKTGKNESAKRSDNAEYISSDMSLETPTDPYWTTPPTNLYSLCHMKTDGAITPIMSNSWTNYVLPNILNEENEFHDDLLFVPYRGGDETVYLDQEYYALTGDKEAAEEKGFVFHTGVYYNIDGEAVPELSEYNGKSIYFCDPFYNGYALMLIKGNALASVGDKQIDPEDGLLMRHEHLPLQDRYVVCDGVIRFRDFYVNVKEKKVIGSDYDADVRFLQ